MSNCSVGPDLVPNCLQRLSADNKSCRALAYAFLVGSFFKFPCDDQVHNSIFRLPQGVKGGHYKNKIKKLTSNYD